MTHDDVVREADRIALGLVATGLAPSTPLAAVVTTSMTFVRLVLGVLFSGSTLVLLTPPKLGASREHWSRTIEEQLRITHATLVIQDGTPSPSVAKSIELSRVARLEEGELPRLDPEDTDVVSFSSGTMGAQKAIVTTHGARYARWERLNALAVGRPPEDETSVGWMPLAAWTLFHNLLYPMAAGSSAVLIPPGIFSADPLSWLRAIGDWRGARSTAPASSYGVVARALKASEERFDLSCWTFAGVGTERTDLTTLNEFTETASHHGFDPSAWAPFYGFTEFGGVTSTPYGEGLRVDYVNRQELGEGVAERCDPPDARSTPVVSVGVPRPNVNMRIEDEDGNEVPDRRVGEIVVRGPSAMRGYLAGDGALDAIQPGAWLRSGDQGYVADGYVYVTGRIKNIIIVRGRNYSGEEIEAVAKRLASGEIRRAAAIGIPSAHGEDLVLVAEVGVDEPNTIGNIREKLRRGIFLELGITPRAIALVPSALLPLTETEKTGRFYVRNAYERGEFDAYV